MKDMNEMYKVLKIINGDLNIEKSPIPIISFEGLPGSGKTTQIKLVSKKLEKFFGKINYIDLPTISPIGEIARTLYSNVNEWDKIRKKVPWLNPVIISTDLRLAIKKAVDEDSKYVIMSRGLLSTYYYNYDTYKMFESNIWEIMTKHLKAFYKPTIIIFLEIPENIARERVVKRNRGKLRGMDSENQMKKDRVFLNEYLKKMENIPIYYIDAVGTEDEVTDRIIKRLKECIPYV